MGTFGHIAGILKDPKTSGLLFEHERYSANTKVLTQISILAAIPVVAVHVGGTQVDWLVDGEDPVRLAESDALGSVLLFYFAIWATVASIEVCLYRMEKTYGDEVPLAQFLALTTVTANPPLLSVNSFVLPMLWVIVVVAVAALAYPV